MPSEHQQIEQSSALPPAQPAYVLRGHSAQVHAVCFLRENLRLLTADADGWVVLWNIPIRRPVAVWRAHSTTILGVESWDDDKITTHGRDNKLNIWQLREADETTLSSILPIEDNCTERHQPWLLHSLPVNAINFCSFTSLPSLDTNTITIANPGLQDGTINLTSFPSEQRLATILTPQDIQTGMLMALKLHRRHRTDANDLLVLAGYESGHAVIWQQNPTGHWQTTYTHKAHAQPILSLAISTQLTCFFTSSADAVIAQHPLSNEGGPSTKITQTKHAGQQSLCVRSDGRVFATAGWDGRVRVYSPKTLREIAVLKWHKEGCYAVAFADVRVDAAEGGDEGNEQALTVAEQRVERARSTHWLAAGSKDGKVSLWDIY